MLTARTGLAKIQLKTIKDAAGEPWLRSLMFKPFYIPEEAWQSIWINAVAGLGRGLGNLVPRLGRISTQLSVLGQRVEDLGQLINFELQLADGGAAGLWLECVDDLWAEGTLIAFSRCYPARISSRHHNNSALGNGWTHNYAESVKFVPGFAVLSQSGHTHLLEYLPDLGVYRGPAGTMRNYSDTSALERPTGEIATFNGSTGVLMSLADKYTASTMVTFDYELMSNITTTSAFNAIVPVLVTVLDHTTNATLDFTYDVRGRIVSVTLFAPGTPPVNATVTYTYDSNGGLASVLNGHATSYAWTAPHQLSLVSNASGVVSTFKYEAGTGFAIHRTRLDGAAQRMMALSVPYDHGRDAGTFPLEFPSYPGDESLWAGSSILNGLPNASVRVMLDKDFYVSGLSAGDRSLMVSNYGLGFKVHRVESSLSSITQTYRADGLELVSPSGAEFEIEVNTSTASVEVIALPSGALFEYEYDALGRVTDIALRGEPYRAFTCVYLSPFFVCSLSIYCD